MFAGADGLDALRVIVAGADHWLAEGGYSWSRSAPDRATAASRLAVGAGLHQVEIRHDLAGHERILIATKGAEPRR